MVFGLILHPARATRLVQQHAVNAQQPSLENVIDKMIGSTFKAAPRQGYEAQLQITANHALLSNLIRLTAGNNASVQARAVASLKIDQLQAWLIEKLKTTTQETWKAHYAFELSTILAFRDDPKEFEIENFLQAPPGQPIGQDDEYCSWGN
jgi:hypothetical protein